MAAVSDRPTLPSPSSRTTAPRRLDVSWLLPPLHLPEERAPETTPTGGHREALLDGVADLLHDLRGLNSELETSAEALPTDELRSLTVSVGKWMGGEVGMGWSCNKTS